MSGGKGKISSMFGKILNFPGVVERPNVEPEPKKYTASKKWNKKFKVSL